MLMTLLKGINTIFTNSLLKESPLTYDYNCFMLDSKQKTVFTFYIIQKFYQMSDFKLIVVTINFLLQCFTQFQNDIKYLCVCHYLNAICIFL